MQATTGMWSRYCPVIHHVRELLEDRTIGDVRHVQAGMGDGFESSNKRIWECTLGGSKLMNIGVFPLSIVTLSLGTDPSHISTVGQLTEDERLDVYASVTLVYGSKGGSQPSFGTFPSWDTVSIYYSNKLDQRRACRPTRGAGVLAV